MCITPPCAQGGAIIVLIILLTSDCDAPVPCLSIGETRGISPFLTGCDRRIHAAIFSFITGVMPPMGPDFQFCATSPSLASLKFLLGRCVAAFRLVPIHSPRPNNFLLHGHVFPYGPPTHKLSLRCENSEGHLEFPSTIHLVVSGTDAVVRHLRRRECFECSDGHCRP
jgi:hypothetical protein